MEGLAKAGVKPLRVGSQGNIRSSLIPHSLDSKLQMHHLSATFKKMTVDIESLANKIRVLGASYITALRKNQDSEKPPTKGQVAKVDNMFRDLEMKKNRIKGMQKMKYALERQMLRDVVADADVVRLSLVLG